MELIIAYQTPDGVHFVCPCPKARDLDESDKDFAERVKRKDVPTEFLNRAEVISRSKVPQSREFRDAWKHVLGQGVHVDMEKARAIHMARIRVARDKELLKSDPVLLQAIEKENKVEADETKAQRQILRDIPQTFVLSEARTPGELSALWPASLPR
jgi:hypothetical protein